MNGRWVVVDVETSGLDAQRDALISIGALGVRDGVIDLADSFEVVLRQASASSHANIEVHCIGGSEQAEGLEPAAALRGFLDFIGDDPPVAYHAPFDQAVLERAMKEHLRTSWRRTWLDLADVAPLAWPGRADPRRGLDGWLEAMAIPIAYRHRAIVDCLATAQLLLMVLHDAARLGARTPKQLLGLSGASRWLGGR